MDSSPKIFRGMSGHFFGGEGTIYIDFSPRQSLCLSVQYIWVFQASSVISKGYDMTISCNGRRIETRILVIFPSHSKNVQVQIKFRILLYEKNDHSVASVKDESIGLET